MNSCWRSVAVVLFLSLLTGCWDRRELNELAIAVELGIDKEGDQYKVSAQIVSPLALSPNKGGGERTPVITYKATGRTILQALRRMTTESPRKIYTAHLRILVLGEEMAKEGIAPMLDVFPRDPEISSDMLVIVTRGVKAEDILEIPTALERIPADQLSSSLSISKKVWATTAKIKVDDLITGIISKGKGAVLPGIEVVGDLEQGKKKDNVQNPEVKTIMRYSGLAVFKGDKLIGWLNERESKGYNYIQGNVSSTTINLACPGGGMITVELLRASKKLKGGIETGRPAVHVKIKAEGNVAESQCTEDVLNPKTIDALEKQTEKSITTTIEEAVQSVQDQYQSDIFGFGEVIHRANPIAWKQLKGDWDKEFKTLSVDVQADVKIRRIGIVTQSIEQKLKEQP
jgi:spore germination protein KC